jgi:hypothetical protein
MIIRATAPTITSNLKAKEFTIRASGKAFRALSSTLYSDKPMAVVRELLANAADIHAQIGNFNPPLIHLPNTFEPFFSIRDYGTGLSVEQAETLYTTYFESTKENTNTQVGCLGLGSKSFFAYTDSATVLSFFNGTKYTYNVFLGNGGIPSIALLGEEPTTEPNGLEVSVPVSPDDFETFRGKLEYAVSRHAIKPTVVGNDNYEPKNVKYIERNPLWAHRESDNYRNEIFAVMGGIAYPISLPEAETTPAQKSILGMNLDLFFEIGQVDVAISREALSYDPETKAVILARIDEIHAEINQRFRSDLATAPTLWDARLIAWSLKSSRSQGSLGYYQWRNVIEDVSLEWNGQSVSRNIVEIPAALDVQMATKPYGRRGKKRLTFDLCNHIGVSERLYVFVRDIDKTGDARLYSYLAGQSFNSAPVVSVANAQALADILGCSVSMFSKMSELPLPPKNIYGGTQSDKAKSRVLVYNGSASYRKASNWNTEAVDVSAGGVYVVIDRYNCQAHNAFASGCVRTYLKNIEAAIKEMGVAIGTIKLHGIKRAAVDSFKKKGKWIELFDYYKSIATEHYDKNAATAQTQKTCAEFLSYIRYNRASMVKDLATTGMAPTHAVMDLARDIIEARKSSVSTSESVLNRVAQRFGLTLHSFDPKELDDKKTKTDSFFQKYPMLEWLAKEWSGGAEVVSDAQDYMKLVDATSIPAII